MFDNLLNMIADFFHLIGNTVMGATLIISLFACILISVEAKWKILGTSDYHLKKYLKNLMKYSCIGIGIAILFFIMGMFIAAK